MRVKGDAIVSYGGLRKDVTSAREVLERRSKRCPMDSATLRILEALDDAFDFLSPLAAKIAALTRSNFLNNMCQIILRKSEHRKHHGSRAHIARGSSAAESMILYQLLIISRS